MCLNAARFQGVQDEFGRRFIQLLSKNIEALAAYRGLLAGSMQPDRFFETYMPLGAGAR